MLYLRSAIFSIVYFFATIGYGTLALFLYFLPERIRHRIIISWTGAMIFAVRIICGVKYTVTGTENLAGIQQQPMVVLSKHQSTWETLFLQNLCFPASTVLKQELLKIPFFGWGLRALMPIAIDRSNPRVALKNVREKGVQRLKDGYNILLFPEGTRTKTGEAGKYARSGADIAIDAGVSILPIALNAGYFWPIGTFLKIPGTISVVIGAPISVEGKTSKQLIQQVETWIESTMATISPP